MLHIPLLSRLLAGENYAYPIDTLTTNLSTLYTDTMVGDRRAARSSVPTAGGDLASQRLPATRVQDGWESRQQPGPLSWVLAGCQSACKRCHSLSGTPRLLTGCPRPTHSGRMAVRLQTLSIPSKDRATAGRALTGFQPAHKLSQVLSGTASRKQRPEHLG